jgi:hypothetical protein
MLRAYKAWDTIDHPRAWVRAVASREYFRSRLTCNENPIAEIAKELGMKPNAVRASLHKARESLKKHLEQEGAAP